MSTLLLVSRCSLYPKITSRTCLIIRTRLPHGESLQNPFRKSSHNKYLLSSTFSCEKKYFDFFTTMDVAESWSNHAHACTMWMTNTSLISIFTILVAIPSIFYTSSTTHNIRRLSILNSSSQITEPGMQKNRYNAKRESGGRAVRDG
jgi:hypothetical protein